MMIPKFTLTLLASSLLLQNTVTAFRPKECPNGEELFQFVFYLDEDSLEENGWTLTCDGQGVVWDVPPGAIQTTDPGALGCLQPNAPGEDTYSYVWDEICLSEDLTCEFTMLDSFGSGLWFPGFYYLMYGAETITVSEEDAEFREAKYCFGADCPKDSLEVQEDCDSVYLYFKTDTKPQDYSVSIACDGEVAFEKSDFLEPFEEIEYEACIPSQSCCSFMVNDADHLGMTLGDADEEEFGTIYLEWANEKVLQYDGVDGYEFSQLGVDFGNACVRKSSTTDDNEDTVETEPESEDGGERAVPSDLDTVVELNDEKDGLKTGVLIAIIALSLAVVGCLVWFILLCARDQREVAAASSEVKEGQSFETDVDDDEV